VLPKLTPHEAKNQSKLVPKHGFHDLLSKIEVLNFLAEGEPVCRATVMTVFLSQGCNKPSPCFITSHNGTQQISVLVFPSVRKNLMTLRVSHLAAFLIDIFHKNKYCESSFGNDMDRRCFLGSRNPPLPLNVAIFWKKILTARHP